MPMKLWISTGDVAIVAARLGIMPNRASTSRRPAFEASGAESSVWTGKRAMELPFTVAIEPEAAGRNRAVAIDAPASEFDGSHLAAPGRERSPNSPHST